MANMSVYIAAVHLLMSSFSVLLSFPSPFRPWARLRFVTLITISHRGPVGSNYIVPTHLATATIIPAYLPQKKLAHAYDTSIFHITLIINVILLGIVALRHHAFFILFQLPSQEVKTHIISATNNIHFATYLSPRLQSAVYTTPTSQN